MRQHLKEEERDLGKGLVLVLTLQGRALSQALSSTFMSLVQMIENEFSTYSRLLDKRTVVVMAGI